MSDSSYALGAALALAGGALLLFVAWWLMPDAATNDAAHILDAIAAQREAVRLSAVLQLVGCALMAVGVLPLASLGDSPPRVSVSILLVGILGMAVDAVYHQVGYQAAAPDVARDDVLPVFHRLQTEDIWSLVPLLGAFVAGVPLVGFQLLRRGQAPKWVCWTLGLVPATAVLGAGLARGSGLPRRAVFLVVLAQMCVGLAALGAVQARRAMGIEKR